MKWLARYPIYPFLFVFILLSSLIIHNVGQIPIEYMIRPLLIIWVLTFTVLLFIAKSTNDIHRAGFLVSLGLVGFFSFGLAAISIQRELPGLNGNLIGFALLAVWMILFVFLGHSWLWRKVTNPKFLTFALNLIFLFSISYPVIIYVQFLLQKGLFEKNENTVVTHQFDKIPSLTATQTPDIYVIILDAYGRSDVLQELYQVDNRPFLNELESRGFYIAERSHSNYMLTPLSIAALLNFQYHGEQDPSTNQLVSEIDLRRPIIDNRLVPALEAIGYSTIAFDSGFQLTNLLEIGSFNSPYIRLNQIEEILLAITPLKLISNNIEIGLPVYNYRTHLSRLNNILEGLRAVPEDPESTFVFAHLLLPHPPFIFDREGNVKESDRPYSINDGDDFEGSPEEYYFGYREQVQYTSISILDIIDEILAKSENPPIIIVQGDHGPGMFHDWDGFTQTCLYERSSILNALYLPGIDPSILYPEISPVNSFRIILNEYFGASLDLLTDRTYYSTWQDLGVMPDVTEIRNSKNNCECLYVNRPVEVISILAGD